jgi:hypothetical protein
MACERPTERETTMIKCGHCGGRHGNVLEVRNCSGTQVADAKRKADAGWAILDRGAEKAEYAAREAAQERVTSAVVDVLERPAPTRVTEDGMYRTPDGAIFKIQKAVHGSGRLYAKQLVVDLENGDRLARFMLGKHDAKQPNASVSFVYAPGAINRLSAEDKMTMEDAAKFGALYGTCCRCGRTLTDEESIAAGIGPICAGKF